MIIRAILNNRSDNLKCTDFQITFTRVTACKMDLNIHAESQILITNESQIV